MYVSQINFLHKTAVGMKKLILILVAISTLLVLPAKQISAQDRANATAQVSATIIIPLTATEASQLNFGRFFPGDQGGTIAISPNGNVSTSSTVVADASPRNPGSFFVSGQVDATFSIALPEGPATLTSTSDSKTMMVSDWVSIPDNNVSGIKLDGGIQTVLIGATLNVGSIDENPRGIYTGSYQITFAYN
jgi:hypothetical protein